MNLELKCGRTARLYVALCLGLLGVAQPSRAEPHSHRLPPPYFASEQPTDLEVKATQAFNESGCASVGDLIGPPQAQRLSPLTSALLAYCQADATSDARLLETATLVPQDENIALLRALSVWNRDKEAARPLWESLKDGELAAIAQSYLADATPKETPHLNRNWHYFASTFVGAGVETNPMGIAEAELKPPASGFLDARLTGGVRRVFTNTSLGLNYAGISDSYWKDRSSDFFRQDGELLFQIRAGEHEDIKIRPFGNFSLRGGGAYSLEGGLGIVGVVYQGKARQSLQGSVFSDHFYDPRLRAQAGTHFRFDYLWDLYLPSTFLRFNAFVEHVQAGRDRDRLGQTLLNYSHNNLGLLGFSEWDLEWILLGLNASLLLREDDLDSSYVAGNGGSAPIRKRREDFQFLLQPSVGFPLSNALQVYLWAKWNHRFSNVGERDYADMNLDDKAVGISLRYFLGSS